MSEELRALFKRINSTADFSEVDFSDVNATNGLGENALHIAVRWGDIDAVKLLITAEIDVNKHGECGYTPLHYAAQYCHKEIVRLLLDSGANPFARTEGDMPSMLARLKENQAICNLLDEYMRKSPYRPKGWIFSGEDLINRKD